MRIPLFVILLTFPLINPLLYLASFLLPFPYFLPPKPVNIHETVTLILTPFLYSDTTDRYWTKYLNVILELCVYKWMIQK